MKSVAATMPSKGQVTVPAELRRTLGLKPGDKLVFAEDPAGKICIEARRETLADLRGIVGRPPEATAGAVTSARIADWIEEGRGARWRRSRDDTA